MEKFHQISNLKMNPMWLTYLGSQFCLLRHPSFLVNSSIRFASGQFIILFPFYRNLWFHQLYLVLYSLYSFQFPTSSVSEDSRGSPVHVMVFIPLDKIFHRSFLYNPISVFGFCGDGLRIMLEIPSCLPVILRLYVRKHFNILKEPLL